MTDLGIAQQRDVPTRAAIARVTLQLRAARAEANRAAEELAKADADAAQRDLRNRLDDIVAERRCHLEAMIERARIDADLTLASARNTAQQLLDEARAALESRPVALPAPVVPEPRKVLVMQTGPTPDQTVAVDLDTLARTIATAVADVFDERFPHLMHPQQMGVPMGYRGVDVIDVPKKRGVMRELLHTDVMLIALTAVLSIVVLVAWMG